MKIASLWLLGRFWRLGHHGERVYQKLFHCMSWNVGLLVLLSENKRNHQNMLDTDYKDSKLIMVRVNQPGNSSQLYIGSLNSRGSTSSKGPDAKIMVRFKPWTAGWSRQQMEASLNCNLPKDLFLVTQRTSSSKQFFISVFETTLALWQTLQGYVNI